MKNQILSEEFRKMQKLAGIITESQLTEMNTPSAASVWDNDLTYEEKEDIALGYLDGAEDIDAVVNTPFSALRGDIQRGVEEYVSTIGTSNPNAYTDDIYNYSGEMEDFPFDTDEDDTFAESKLIKLKQFIKEEIQKMLNENVKKGYGLKPEEEKIVDDLFKDWKKDKSNDAIKNIKNTEKYKSLSISATNKLNAIIRSAEQMES